MVQLACHTASMVTELDALVLSVLCSVNIAVMVQRPVITDRAPVAPTSTSAIVACACYSACDMAVIML